MHRVNSTYVYSSIMLVHYTSELHKKKSLRITINVSDSQNPRRHQLTNMITHRKILQMTLLGTRSTTINTIQYIGGLSSSTLNKLHKCHSIRLWGNFIIWVKRAELTTSLTPTKIVDVAHCSFKTGATNPTFFHATQLNVTKCYESHSALHPVISLLCRASSCIKKRVYFLFSSLLLE